MVTIPQTVQLQLQPPAAAPIDLMPEVYPVTEVIPAVTPVSPAPSSTKAAGGKIKSSKKSQNNTTTIIKAAAPSIQVSDDDDLSNIASFETRVNIISQRVSIERHAYFDIKLLVYSALATFSAG